MSERPKAMVPGFEGLDELSLIQTIIDAIPDPFFCKDREGRFLLVNKANSSLFGLRPEDKIGRTVYEIAGAREYADQYTADDHAVLESRQPIINREEPFELADGRKGWFLTSKFPIIDTDGEVLGLVGIARDITTRREAERRLEDERRLLQTVIDAIPDPLFFKDREGRHLLYNKANAQLFGLSELQYLGRTVFELPISADLAANYHEDDQQVLQSGEPIVNREEPYETFGQVKGWFLTSKFPIRDSTGLITGLVGICRDITARRMMEKDLHDERNFLQTLIDAIPDLIFFKDREGRHMHINAADRRMFGVGDDFLGKTVHEWPIPTDLADAYAEDDRSVFQTGNPIYNKEEQFLRPDGQRGWLLTSKLPLRDEKGDIIGLVGIARDITELKRDREELEGARQRLIDHVVNSPLAVIEWLPDFRVARWVGRAQEIFGWSAAEVEGRHFFDWPFVHPEDSEKVAEVTAQLIDGGYDRNVSRNRNLNSAGEVVHCVWQNSVLRDAAGRIVSVLSLVQDVTEQVRAEEAVQRAAKERADIESKLQEAQKLESLGVLAGGIAHDFNNLLTSVIGNASMARSEVAANSAVGVCLQQIELAATRAAELCQQMLAYSGRGRFVVQRVDLNRLIAETSSLINSSISKAANLVFQLAPDLPMVMADEVQMRQILMNLVINASESLGLDTGAIRVSTGVMSVTRGWLTRAHLAPDLGEGDYVFLDVADTGCGMVPEVRAKIFDPFFTTKFTGRGLGLAAVLGIVRGHDGAVRVESEAGRGTTIRVIFPKAVLGEVTLPEPAPPKAAEPWRGSGKILAVDDEEVVRMVTGRMLKALGFTVEFAVDGVDCVQKFSASPDEYRLVLLDLTMPEQDGESTFREIQKIKPNACVVLMSGFNEQEVVSHFGGSGLAGFLQKPFTLDQVEAKLREVLE